MGEGRRSAARAEIETFVRRVIAAIEEARARGAGDPRAIAEALNRRNLTTRKGRSWTGPTVAKFMNSPGARRYRSGG